MTPELARAALAFLSRVDLKGHEVAAFVEVCQMLNVAVSRVVPPVRTVKPRAKKTAVAPGCIPVVSNTDNIVSQESV